MLMLLKEKSKVIYKPKERRRFRPYLQEERNEDLGARSNPDRSDPKETKARETKKKKINPTFLGGLDDEM